MTATESRTPAVPEDFPADYPSTGTLSVGEDQILDDGSIKLVTGAAVPSERGPLGCRIMAAGKDYFTDKTPFT